MPQSNSDSGQRASQIIEIVLSIIFLTCGSWIAHRNYAKGKSDLQGALRLALGVFIVEIAIWLCRNHFTPTIATAGRFILAVSTGLFLSAIMGILYLALEPFVRRHWPQAIVSWSRLMAGRVRDPLVGRDVLWGVTLGIIWSVVISAGFVVTRRMGETPQLSSQALLTGGRQLAGIWLLEVVQCILATLQLFFIFFLLRVILRNKWLAAAGFVAIFGTMNTLRNGHPEILAPVWLAVFSIAAYAATRYGLITLAVAIFTANVLLNVPYTLDFSNWYAADSLAVVLSFVAIAAWGFHTSLAGRRLFKEDLFQ